MVITKSVVKRYLLLSVLASIIPVLAVGLLYDRLTDTALEHMLGERLSSHLTATANRLGAFMETRRYQAETMANYPGIAALALDPNAKPTDDIAALLQVESDLPDLYGILFFAPDGHLTRVVPGQAASGMPYWNNQFFSVGTLPRTAMGDAEIIGPMPANRDDSGWLLIRQPIPALRGGEGNSGYLALHVRLASLSEQLGSTAAIGALKPVLHTPMGDFDNVGRQVRPDRQLIDGPEFLPGWRPKLEVESAGLIKSFDGERRALLLAVLAGAAVIAFLYFRLSRHLRQRMRHLLRGTQAISAGDWGHRVPEDGEDEIASVSHALNKMSGKLQETLEEAVRMERLAVLGRFATGIAHEIRNPLAALKTTTQALARREADDKRRQLLADMESEIDRLAGVVNDLVDFGRPRDPKPAAVPVREVFRKVFLTTESKAQLRMIHLSCHGDSDLTLWVDHDQLMQIILNLVLNAIEATPAEGAVMLRSCEENGRAHLEVSDTGCGIADEIRERVIEPFFTTKSRGVGLGLSIARQLIELNQGELLIDSRAGRGTSVHVFLPLAP